MCAHLNTSGGFKALLAECGTALALEALGLVLPARMHERVIYAETFAHGKTAIEIDPKGVAAQEIASLWSSIKEKI